jgi:hypothetical protein
MDQSDKALAAAVLARIQAAKVELAAKMVTAGLCERDGWRVLEELRSTPNGTQFVFRPVHTRLDPPGLEAVVTIDSDGTPA